MKRIFVTNMLADSMFNLLDNTEIKINKSSLEELKNVIETAEPISAIRNQKIVDTLDERYGIKLESSSIRFSLEKGDTLYVINPGSNPNDSPDNLLPEWATISIKKYEVGA